MKLLLLNDGAFEVEQLDSGARKGDRVVVSRRLELELDRRRHGFALTKKRNHTLRLLPTVVVAIDGEGWNSVRMMELK